MFGKLDDLQGRPCIWICGPPGAGKTTAIASWLETRKVTAYWYQADAGDRDVATFFDYLGELARQSFGTRARTLPYLTPDHVRDLQGFSRRFLREWFALLPDGASLVIDNHHEAACDAFDDLLRQAIAEAPRNAQLIIISRMDVQQQFLKALSLGQIGRIGWEDLRFAPSETAALLKRRSITSEVDAQDLHVLSGGWAAGVVLMSAHPTIRTPISGNGLALSADAVFAYFAEEVIAACSPIDRQLLQFTSCFSQFTVAMASELTGHPKAESVLESFYLQHYFTERRSSSVPEYRYHDLFRVYLQDSARTSLGDHSWNAVLEKAASIHLQRGEPEAAADLLTKASAWFLLCDLVANHAKAMLARGRWQALLGLVGAIPDELVRRDPWLLYWKGKAAAIQDASLGRLDLQGAYGAFTALGQVEGRILSCSAILDSHLQEWNFAEPLDHWISEMADLLTGNAGESSAHRTEAIIGLATALLYRDPCNAQLSELVAEIQNVLPAEQDVNIRVPGTALLLDYLSLMGDFGRCESIIEFTSTDAGSEACSPANSFLWWRWAGYVSFRRGDFVRAGNRLRQSLKLANEHGLLDQQSIALLSVAIVEASVGNLEEARSLLNAMRTNLDPRQPLHAIGYHYLDFWLAILREDKTAATRIWEMFATMPVAGVPVNYCYNHAVVWFLVESGRGSLALERVTNWTSALSRMGSPLLNFNLLAMQAYTELKLGLDQRAAQSLKALFKLGRTYDFMGMLTWIPQMMATLCAAAIEIDIEPRYVRRLIHERGLRPPVASIPAWPRSIQVMTLGSFALLRDGHAVAFGRKVPKRPLALLKAIIAAGPPGLATAKAESWLWPDLDGDAATEALTTALLRLRRLLGAKDTVLLTGSMLRLNENAIWVDAFAFERLSDADDSMEPALALYGGAFLPADEVDAWTVPVRDRLRARFAALSEKHGLALESSQQFERAVECYCRAIEADPLAETLYQGLMRCYVAQGREVEASAVFRRLRNTLSVILGKRPSPKSLLLARALFQE